MNFEGESYPQNPVQKPEYTNPIAEVGNPDSGWIVSPVEASVHKGSYRFFCPDFDCHDPYRILSLKKSSQGNYFFSHRPGYGHNIGPETLLHKLAVKWFQGKEEFEVPEVIANGIKIPKQTLLLNPEKTQLEYSRLKRIKPDVKLETVSGFEFAIEIVVTSDVTDKKSKLIAEFGLPTLRITLTNFYRKYPNECRTRKEFIEAFLPSLLGNLDNKHWVIPPTKEESSTLNPEELPVEIVVEEKPIDPPKTPAKSEPVGCMVILPFIGFIWLLKWIFS